MVENEYGALPLSFHSPEQCHDTSQRRHGLGASGRGKYGRDGRISSQPTGYDEENLLLALTAKQRGIEDVISKVSHENYKDLIERMGVDMVLNPLNITASNILRFIQGDKKIISSLLLQGQAEIMEIVAHSHMQIIDVPLKKLNLSSGVLIAAIHRGQKVIIPDGDTEIKWNDRVIILSLLSEIGDLEKLLKNKN